MRQQTAIAAGVVVAVAAYAVLALRWVSSDPGWYDALPKPSWQPPDWVFGVAWPYNFLALAVVGVTLAVRTPGRTSVGWLAVLVTDVVLALTWAYLFYVPHALAAAAVALGAAAALAWVLDVIAWRALPWTGVALLPYAIWLSVATSLAIGFALQPSTS
jgi:tryptophan-rich sensory protein